MNKLLTVLLAAMVSGCAALTEFAYPIVGPNGEGCEAYGVPAGAPMGCETDAAGNVAINVLPWHEVQAICTGNDPWVEAWGCVVTDDDGVTRAYAVPRAGLLVHRAEECHCKRGPSHMIGATHRPGKSLFEPDSDWWMGR